MLDGRTAIGRAQVRRQEESVRTGFISQAALEVAQSDLMALQAQKQALRRSQAALQRDRTNIEAARRETTLQLQAEVADLQAATASTLQEISENDAKAVTVVSAPYSGAVHGISVQVGLSGAAAAARASSLHRRRQRSKS